MQAPEWNQRVLFVTADPDVGRTVSSIFGHETQLRKAAGFDDAIRALEQDSIEVLIIDEKACEKDNQLFELTQYANQLNNRLTSILLVNKLASRKGDFARKSGASLIMDRKEIQIGKIVYVIRVLRKRTFRTIASRDLPDGFVPAVDLFHYMPLSNRYAVFLPAGTPFDPHRRQKLVASNLHHLFVKEGSFELLLNDLRTTPGHGTLLSEEFSAIREAYRQVLIRFFDLSTDGHIHSGREIFEGAVEIAKRLEICIESLGSTPMPALTELAYPRWSALAHGLNCAIYALLFAGPAELPDPRDIAIAALFHNIGLSEISQEILKKRETELGPSERAEYQSHVERSVQMLRRKQVPLPPRIVQAIACHHENFDGSGFPNALFGDAIPKEACLLSIVGSLDYFKSVRPGEKALDIREAWKRVVEHHTGGSGAGAKFHPKILQNIGAVLA